MLYFKILSGIKFTLFPEIIGWYWAMVTHHSSIALDWLSFYFYTIFVVEFFFHYGVFLMIIWRTLFSNPSIIAVTLFRRYIVLRGCRKQWASRFEISWRALSISSWTLSKTLIVFSIFWEFIGIWFNHKFVYVCLLGNYPSDYWGGNCENYKSYNDFNPLSGIIFLNLLIHLLPLGFFLGYMGFNHLVKRFYLLG